MFEIANGKLFKVIVRAIVDVEIYVALDARQTTNIRVLPKFPRTFVLHLIYIVVGYPIGIVIENGCTEIGFLKFIIGGINYGY